MSFAPSGIVVRRRSGLWGVVILALALGAGAGTAQAQSTYSYTGAPYSSTTNFTTCEAGDCRNYSSGQSVSGSFQTANPLAPNLSNAEISSLVTAFNFSDGLTTYSSSDPQAYVFTLSVTTDGTGAITSALAAFVRHQTATLAVAAGAPLNNPNTKIDTLLVTGGTFSRHNATCSTVGTSGSGRPNSCTQIRVADVGRSEATASTSRQWVSPAPVPVAVVPTMSEWALIIFGTILIGGTAMVLYRRPDLNV